MAGKKSDTQKKVYTIGGEEVTDLKQITLPMITAHVKSLGKKDVEWLVKTMKKEIPKKKDDGTEVKRKPTYIDVRNAFANEYFPDLAPKGTTKKAKAMKDTLAELEALLKEED